MARAFVAALSDIDNTSSEDPSSDEDEPDKNDEKKEKMKDFNGLCFMANDKQSSDELDISEGSYGRLEDKWIIDSGCSRHMTGNFSWFSSFTSSRQRENITFGNNRKCRVKAKEPSSELWMWHRRLGHMSFDLLVRLSALGLIRGLPELKIEKNLICALCRLGKMVFASHYPINMVMTERPDELLHMDTVGPSRVSSVGGKWYVLVVVDDYSRYSWVFFLVSKDEVFMNFQSLALRIFNELPGALKALRSGNGTEFKNSSFADFCREHGIEH